MESNITEINDHKQRQAEIETDINLLLIKLKRLNNDLNSFSALPSVRNFYQAKTDLELALRLLLPPQK